MLTIQPKIFANNLYAQPNQSRLDKINAQDQKPSFKMRNEKTPDWLKQLLAGTIAFVIIMALFAGWNAYRLYQLQGHL